MKVFFDVTKTSRQRHTSGITRTAGRLGATLGHNLGDRWIPVIWNDRDQGWRKSGTRQKVAPERDDWLLTVEPFAPAERMGFSALLEARPCRLAAVFHDAIPLRHPEFTWPKSVARFPAYLKMLSGFDHVFAVSEASRDEIDGYLGWLGTSIRPQVTAIRPGADFLGTARANDPRRRGASRSILSVGILEPRKNQRLLLEVCERLWSDGVHFDLTLVGRVNPHFGKPLVTGMKKLKRTGRPIHHANGISDQELYRLLRACRFLVFPSKAEGCGLPILEALWEGTPCLCSDLAPHRESAEGGGCCLLPVDDPEAWRRELMRLLNDDQAVDQLALDALKRDLPTWNNTAEQILVALEAIP